MDALRTTSLFLQQEAVWWALGWSEAFPSLYSLPLPIHAFKQQDGWCESLRLHEWKSASTRGRKSQEAWAPDWSAAVSGEGGNESTVEASVCLAFSPACWRSNSRSSSKWFCCHAIGYCCSAVWKNSNALNRIYLLLTSLQMQTLFI